MAGSQNFKNHYSSNQTTFFWTSSFRHAMTGLQAEGVIDQAYFVCGAEGSWPSAEAHVAAALTEQWNDAANVFCLAPGTVVAYKSLGMVTITTLGM